MTTDTPAPLDDEDAPTGADSARRRVPRRYGPLVMWRQARANCGPGCLGLHATWPLLRGLGVVPSPRWHTAWYRDLLTQAARHRQRVPRPAVDQPLVVVVVNPEDHLLPATIANLAGTTAVDLHVLSRCATPLAATQRWAARHGQPVTIHHGTLAPEAGPFDLAVVADDSIPCASTREGDRPTIDALVPVVDALAPGAQLVYATRFGPSVMMQHRHEYAGLVRFVQATAGLAWRQQGTPTRWQVAHDRWSQPAPFQVHYQWVGIRDVLTSAGLTNVEVDDDIHERPSRPLRWHPDEITLGAGSQMFRFTASLTGNEPPGPRPAADDSADARSVGGRTTRGVS